MKSRTVFDRAEDSTPYDLAGHLTDWEIIGVGPVAGPGHRWPGRTWASTGITGGYNARDPKNLYHGRGGLTVRLLCTPDYAQEGTPMTLVSRGENGPETFRQWAYRFELIVKPDHITFYLAQWDVAEGRHRIHTIGATGRPPSGHLMALSFVLDGQTVRAYHDGQHVGSAPSSPSFHTADTPITIGHRWRSDTQRTQNHFRGTIESIELADHAGTDASERLWHQTAVIEPELLIEDIDALSAIHGENWKKYRQRPLADVLAETRGQLARLQQAALAPHCYGDLLATHEAALGITTEPGQTVQDRQTVLHQANQSHLGHRPTDLAQYASQLYQVPAHEITIYENSNARTIATAGGPSDLLEDHWILGPGPGVFSLQPNGLTTHVPADTHLTQTGTYLYQGVDLDPTIGKTTLWFRATMTDVASPSSARSGVCWGFRGIQHWLTAHDVDAAWDIYLTTPTESTQLLAGVADRSTMTFDLRFTKGELNIRLIQDGATIYESKQSGHEFADRIGIGITGTGDTTPSQETGATWSDVTIFEPDSEVNYNAAAYHPDPAVKRTLHSELLTRHGDAAARIVAQRHQYHILGASQLNYTLLRQPNTGA